MVVPQGKGMTYRVVVGLEVVANLPSGVPVATKTGLPKKKDRHQKLVYPKYERDKGQKRTKKM